MFRAPLCIAWRTRKVARIGAVACTAVAAALGSGVASAEPLPFAMLSAAMLPPADGALAGTAVEPQAELKRRHARAKKARSTRGARLSRVRAARINRLLRIYRSARAARARIPLARRVAYARSELAEAERLGAHYCLATAIYHEARLESARGQRAVAEVILARTRVPGRPKSVCGVVYEGAWRNTGCQFSFTCDGKSDGARWPGDWAEAKQIAAAALANRGATKRVAKGATFYHANYVRPRWSKRMIRVARIGAHIFYRPRRGRAM